MYIRRQLTNTVIVGILAVIGVAVAVGIGFFGATQFSSGAPPANVGSLSSGEADATPAPVAAGAITPTRTIAPTRTAAPTATPTPTMPPTATPTLTPTPSPTATPSPTPTLSPVGTLRITARIALNVRAGPDTSYAIVDPVRNGDELPVLGQNEAGDWMYIRLPDGEAGWVSRSYTDFPTDQQAPIVATPTQTPQ